MDQKIKNTLVLGVLLLLIVIAGSIYTFAIQKGKISAKEKKLEDLSLNALDPEQLKLQLESLQSRETELDSILNQRDFNIPVGVMQYEFYDFINEVTLDFSEHSYVNVEFMETIPLTHFNYYSYRLTGSATYQDFYKLIYFLEKSKKLKKVRSVTLDNYVKVDKEDIAHYLVNFIINVEVYFANNVRYVSAQLTEHQLEAKPIYNIFYPLIRNEIPPNKDELLDVQNAELLALLPDGAFLTDEKGNTYLLWEGDRVYLGYLTSIDYQNREVMFILNKGGIIERITLDLQKDKKASK